MNERGYRPQSSNDAVWTEDLKTPEGKKEVLAHTKFIKEGIDEQDKCGKEM